MPTSSGRSWVAPHQLPPPISVPLNLKVALSAATTTSTKVMSSAPPPMHAPWTAQTTGLSSASTTRESSIIRAKK
jgi:hypothetical protein